MSLFRIRRKTRKHKNRRYSSNGRYRLSSDFTRGARFETLEDRRMLAIVTVDPGDFPLVYKVDSSTKAAGIRTFDLDPGAHNLRLNDFADISFSVDSSGNVTSGNTGAAQGIGSILALNNTTIIVDPQDYTGLYSLHNTAGVPNGTGVRSVILVPGINNYSVGGFALGMTFDVDAGGNVVSTNPVAAQGVGNTLTFNTTTLNVDPVDYTGTYLMSGVVLNVVTDFQSFVVVPGLTHYFTQIAGVNIQYDVDADGDVTSRNPDSASGIGNTLVFNNVTINIDPGEFDGQFFHSFAFPQPTTPQGYQSLVVVPGGALYAIQIRNGGNFIRFAVDTDGIVTSLTPDAATGVGNTLGLKNSRLRIDPTDYAGTFVFPYIPNVEGSSNNFSGIQDFVVVPSLNYALFSPAGGNVFERFDIAPDGEPSPNIITFTVEDQLLTFVLSQPSPSVSGRVYDDANNDGSDVGDTGLGGLSVTLTGTDDNGPVSLTTATLADGSYLFDEVLPGTYSITTEQPAGLLDGQETAGNLGGTVDNTQDSNTISGIVIGTDGVDATGYNFGNLQPSDLQGLVWQDFNNDGQVNFGEKAIAGVSLVLTGTDDRGNPVSLPAQTDADGIYMFIDLRPGEYIITETQPDGFDDGLDVVGTVNGTTVGDNSLNDVISNIVISAPGSVAENYNFGERPPGGGAVTAGQTATIGFWQNNNGQALIESLNGGGNSTQLSEWLSTTFVNMYGDDGVGATNGNDLTGMTNSEVAAFYSDLFRRKKKEAVQLGLAGPEKMDAQVLAVALATYVTNQSLAGWVAQSYGFEVTEAGLGTVKFNVGDGGQAFDVANDSDVAVLDLLFATDDNSKDGVLYDLDGDGDADDAWEAVLRELANDVYSAINEAGDI